MHLTEKCVSKRKGDNNSMEEYKKKIMYKKWEKG